MQKSITMKYAGFGEAIENSDEEDKCNHILVEATQNLTDAVSKKRELTR